MKIIWKGSPNHWKGRRNIKPIGIVIHIMEGSLAGTDAWFNNSRSRVSAHYGVGKNGEIHRYVSEADSAWHVGNIYKPNCSILLKNRWGRFTNPNLYTIGIENEGFAGQPFTKEMYQANKFLINEISKRWNIPKDRQHIIGHYQIDSRKTCPGSGVDFNKLISKDMTKEKILEKIKKSGRVIIFNSSPENTTGVSRFLWFKNNQLYEIPHSIKDSPATKAGMMANSIGLLNSGVTQLLDRSKKYPNC